MHRALRLFLIALPLVLAGAGCGQGTACTLIFVNGIVITTKGPTGAPICDATVELVDGTYKETLTVVGDVDGGAAAASGCYYAGAGERAGNYTVTVSRTGYQTQTLSIGVTRDECHVHTEQRNLTLSP